MQREIKIYLGKNLTDKNHLNVGYGLNELRAAAEKLSEETNTEEILSELLGEREDKKKKEIKMSLPFFLTNCGEKGHDTKPTDYKGIGVLDFDPIDRNLFGTFLQSDIDDYLEEIDEVLKNIPSTILRYITPSDMGIKSFFLLDNLDPKAHEYNVLCYEKMIKSEILKVNPKLLQLFKIDRTPLVNYASVQFLGDVTRLKIGHIDGIKAWGCPKDEFLSTEYHNFFNNKKHPLPIDNKNPMSLAEIAERKAIINYTENEKKVVLSACYNGTITKLRLDKNTNFDDVVINHKHNDFLCTFFGKSSYNGLEMNDITNFLLKKSNGCADFDKLENLCKLYYNYQYGGVVIVGNYLDVIEKNRANPTDGITKIKDGEYLSDYMEKIGFETKKKLHIVSSTGSGKSFLITEAIKKYFSKDINIYVNPVKLGIESINSESNEKGIKLGIYYGDKKELVNDTHTLTTIDSFVKCLELIKEKNKGKVNIFYDEIQTIGSWGTFKNLQINDILDLMPKFERFYTFTGTELEYFDPRLDFETVRFKKDKKTKSLFGFVRYKHRDSAVSKKMSDIREKDPKAFFMLVLNNTGGQLENVDTKISEKYKFIRINSNIEDDVQSENLTVLNELKNNVAIKDSLDGMIVTDKINSSLSIGFESKRNTYILVLDPAKPYKMLHQIAERFRANLNCLKISVLYFQKFYQTVAKPEGEKPKPYSSDSHKWRIKNVNSAIKDKNDYIAELGADAQSFYSTEFENRVMKDNKYVYLTQKNVLMVNYIKMASENLVSETYHLLKDGGDMYAEKLRDEYDYELTECETVLDTFLDKTLITQKDTPKKEVVGIFDINEIEGWITNMDIKTVLGTNSNRSENSPEKNAYIHFIKRILNEVEYSDNKEPISVKAAAYILKNTCLDTKGKIDVRTPKTKVEFTDENGKKKTKEVVGEKTNDFFEGLEYIKLFETENPHKRKAAMKKLLVGVVNLGEGIHKTSDVYKVFSKNPNISLPLNDIKLILNTFYNCKEDTKKGVFVLKTKENKYTPKK